MDHIKNHKVILLVLGQGKGACDSGNFLLYNRRKIRITYYLSLYLE